MRTKTDPLFTAESLSWAFRPPESERGQLREVADWLHTVTQDSPYGLTSRQVDFMLLFTELRDALELAEAYDETQRALKAEQMTRGRAQKALENANAEIEALRINLAAVQSARAAADDAARGPDAAE